MTRTINTVLFLLFIGTGTFGAWGLFTDGGQRAYDEMDGIIPFWSLCVSLIFLSTMVILNVARLFRRSRDGN